MCNDKSSHLKKVQGKVQAEMSHTFQARPLFLYVQSQKHGLPGDCLLKFVLRHDRESLSQAQAGSMD